MSKIIEGYLAYDFKDQRYQVCYGIEQYTPGLHCGEVLEIFVPERNKWERGRLEMSVQGEWYLYGVPDVLLSGARVRYER